MVSYSESSMEYDWNGNGRVHLRLDADGLVGTQWKSYLRTICLDCASSFLVLMFSAWLSHEIACHKSV